MEIIICCLRGNVRRPSPRTEDAGGRRLLGHDRLLLLRHGDLGGAPLRGLLLVVGVRRPVFHAPMLRRLDRVEGAPGNRPIYSEASRSTAPPKGRSCSRSAILNCARRTAR